MRRGYAYCSDEFAAIHPATRQLHPFLKPLGIKDTSVFPDLAQREDLWLGPEPAPETKERGVGGPVWYVHPEDLAPGSTGSPTRIGYIIFPKYHQGATPRFQPLSPGEAMQQLIENSVNFTRFGGEGLRLLADLIEGAKCYSLVSGGLEETTALIDELVGSAGV